MRAAAVVIFGQQAARESLSHSNEILSTAHRLEHRISQDEHHG